SGVPVLMGVGAAALIAAGAIFAMRVRRPPAPVAMQVTAPAPIEKTAAVNTSGKAAVAMGSISVNASPWGTVHVNGKLAGTTPILRFPVRAGRASVTIENPKLGRKQVEVKIEPKKDTPLIVDLRGEAR